MGLCEEHETEVIKQFVLYSYYNLQLLSFKNKVQL